MKGRNAGEKSPAYRVFVNGGYWGVIYAPSARAACADARERWNRTSRREPIREIEAFELVD